jgi:15-cis-phytoene synthase
VNPEQYCLDKAAPAGSNLYYCSLFYKSPQKRKLHAIFALQQELLDTISECQDAGLARIKLQWWCEEITRLFASEAQHPVSLELQQLLPEFQLDQGQLLYLVNAIEHQISPTPSDSIQSLIDFFIHGRGTIWRLAAEICGAKDKDLITQATTIGGLNSCLEYFQSASQHLQRGYCPYPQIELDKYGLSHDNLMQTDKLSALRHLRDELYNTIFSELEQSLLRLSSMDNRQVLFAIIQANIAQANCKLMQKQTGDIMQTPPSITPLRKLWIAWRTNKTCR